MIVCDILGCLIDGDRRVGDLLVDDSQEDTSVSTTEEGELRRETRAHTNVVLGGVRTKSEVDNGHHVLCWKHGDFLRLQHGRALQFSKAFAGQFDQVPTCWRRVLKVVVDRIDDAQVRLKRFGADGD